MSLYDPDTGLPTSDLFADRLRQSIARADRRKGMLAVLVVDPGGASAKTIAAGLAGKVRRTDTVAHLNGARFGVVQTDLDHFEAAAFLAQKLMEGLEGGASVGIALYPDAGTAPEGLIERAEAALKRAQGAGAPFAFDGRRITARAEDIMRLARELRGAVAAGQLRLHYQPKLEIASGRIVGAEALIRWAHPERGLLMPDDFLPVAEDGEFLDEIGRWALARACADAAGWPDEPNGAAGVAVNVAPLQFEAEGFAKRLREVIEASGLDPARLDLEITESHLMRNPDAVAGLLTELRSLGVGITVDDFGTGYSSLAYLRRLPVDVLKIDKAFVAELPDNDDDATIVRTIVGLAKNLGLRVVAEGVAEEAQLALLRDAGCDEVQGFLIGPAVPSDDFARLLGG